VALIDLDRQPSRLERRIFGMLFAIFFGLLGAMVLLKSGSTRVPVVLWAFGLAVGVAYSAVPALRWPIYSGWTRATYPLGWMVSHAAMALIFFGVLTPCGLLLRVLGRDPMQRSLRRGAASYWAKLEPPSSRSRYFRQS
jgi:surface polysaccharide O-acyltransferase-like enzyme